MGKSIRSKRMKKLRTLKRTKLAPREEILLEQRAAIISTIKGEEVDESQIPQLPEVAHAPKRFVHTRDGTPHRVLTLKERYGHLAKSNTCITKFNTLEALKERYDKQPGVPSKVKKEEGATASSSSSSSSSSSTPRTLPSTVAARRSNRGRDRTAKAVTSSSSADVTVKQEPTDESMADEPSSAAAAAAEPIEVDGDEEDMDEEEDDDDKIRYGEFGKPAHMRRSKMRSKLARKRSKSKGRGGFLNWHNLAATS